MASLDARLGQRFGWWTSTAVLVNTAILVGGVVGLLDAVLELSAGRIDPQSAWLSLAIVAFGAFSVYRLRSLFARVPVENAVGRERLTKALKRGVALGLLLTMISTPLALGMWPQASLPTLRDELTLNFAMKSLLDADTAATAYHRDEMMVERALPTAVSKNFACSRVEVGATFPWYSVVWLPVRVIQNRLGGPIIVQCGTMGPIATATTARLSYTNLRYGLPLGFTKRIDDPAVVR